MTDMAEESLKEVKNNEVKVDDSSCEEGMNLDMPNNTPEVMEDDNAPGNMEQDNNPGSMEEGNKPNDMEEGNKPDKREKGNNPKQMEEGQKPENKEEANKPENTEEEAPVPESKPAEEAKTSNGTDFVEAIEVIKDAVKKSQNKDTIDNINNSIIEDVVNEKEVDKIPASENNGTGEPGAAAMTLKAASQRGAAAVEMSPQVASQPGRPLAAAADTTFKPGGSRAKSTTQSARTNLVVPPGYRLGGHKSVGTTTEGQEGVAN